MLRDWVETAVIDIVGFFCINPNTLFGSIQQGPMLHGYRPEDLEKTGRENSHLRGYSGIDKMSAEQIDEFSTLYKAFAANLFNLMTHALTPYIEQAIDEGYADISCSTRNYRTGMLIVEVFAESPTPSSATLVAFSRKRTSF